MHELSIAHGIADIVCDLVASEDRTRIRTITVDVGQVSGVVPDSLEFCFEAVSREYALPPGALTINRIPFRCTCLSCSKDFGNDAGTVICPSCGSYKTKVLCGRELRVATIDLLDEPKDNSS